MIDWSGSLQTLQLVRLLILVTRPCSLAVGFCRSAIGNVSALSLTIGYLAGVAAFVIYLLLR